MSPNRRGIIRYFKPGTSWVGAFVIGPLTCFLIVPPLFSIQVAWQALPLFSAAGFGLGLFRDMKTAESTR